METDAPAVVVEVKEAMEKLAVDENFENKDPKPETGLSAAAKKKNKKKKKATSTEEKTTVEDKEDCKEGAEQKEALATVDENKDSAEVRSLCLSENVLNISLQVGCAHCKKAGPSKRCSKRHPKCLKKMFCNEVRILWSVFFTLCPDLRGPGSRRSQESCCQEGGGWQDCGR